MRQLLGIMIAFALALLPFGSMARSAHAAMHPAAAQDCHHGPKTASPADRSHHGHHGHHAGTGAEALIDDVAAHHPADTGAAQKSPCPACGSDCTCVGTCGVSCGAGLAPASPVSVPSESGVRVRPALTIAFNPVITRPWPPPPRT